jgi:hypothetical protein
MWRPTTLPAGNNDRSSRSLMIATACVSRESVQVKSRPRSTRTPTVSKKRGGMRSMSAPVAWLTEAAILSNAVVAVRRSSISRREAAIRIEYQESDGRWDDDEVDFPDLHYRKDMASLRWVKPRVVVEVAFTEWTVGGKLRQRVLLGVRRETD